MSQDRKLVASRRSDILEAALAVIEERGIAHVRGSDIAKRADISQGLVFYHFENLPTLLAEAIALAASRDLEQLGSASAATGGGSASIRLTEVLRQYGPTGTAFGWRLWIESWSASLRSAELRAVVAELDEGWRRAIVDLIVEGVREGEFQCADPDGAAWRLTAMVDGLAVKYVVFDDVVTLEQIGAWIAGAVERELGVEQGVISAELID